MIMVGRSLRAMSLRKSSIRASTQATVPIGDAPIATVQLASIARSLTSFPFAPPYYRDSVDTVTTKQRWTDSMALREPADELHRLSRADIYCAKSRM
jgi:hypothetical protein